MYNRGDNYVVGGTWKVVTKYAYVDFGIGTLANPLSVTPETITDWSISN